MQWRAVTGQVSAVWLAGSICGHVVPTMAVLALWTGSGAGAAGVALLMLLGVLITYGIGSLTPAGSPLTGSRGRRVTWAVLVYGGGQALWLAGAFIAAEADLSLGLGSPAATALGGLPFALVSAFLAGRRTAVGALAVTVGLSVWSAYLIGQEDTREEIASRPGIDRPLMYVTATPPGYRTTRDFPGTSIFFTPVDQRVVTVWQDHDITVSVRRETAEGCPQGPLAVTFGQDEKPECAAERPDLWYVTGRIPEPEWGCPCGLHQYVRRDGEVLIRVGGSDAVDRTLLRQIILNARPATDAEIETLFTTMPG
ncbi:hypothetical protein [Planomonospora venezuelensis]|uniref:Uncharacterized protein n=1 Tax=Planomonospora venezuelensis TaxID=1999 RepID=A0A841DCH4_PLAVE|nr:hypothetical protein [Planomonospora venezuelensis]MBB5966493.1 hypothetical protein [Planomonospora venezuelensis]GIN02328.1 hypothetical protein Pve01_39860 [Planomonospora venezuelensis]